MLHCLVLYDMQYGGGHFLLQLQNAVLYAAAKSAAKLDQTSAPKMEKWRRSFVPSRPNKIAKWQDVREGSGYKTAHSRRL